MIDYHDDPRIGCSMLKVAENRPWEYRDVYVEKTRAGLDLSERVNIGIGTVVHQVLLEGRDIDDVAVGIPADCLKSNGAVNPHRMKEYRALNAGKVVLKDADWKRVVGCINAVRSHELGNLLKEPGITFEEPIYWEDSETGLECKARPDFCYLGDGVVVSYDLKVSEVVSPDGWGRVARRLQYWLQDMHYSSGLSHLHGQPVAFVFWVVESAYPHRIARYEYDQISRERASESYRMVMKRLKKRLDDGDWRDDWESDRNTLTLYPWELGVTEDGELEGFDNEEESS